MDITTVVVVALFIHATVLGETRLLVTKRREIKNKFVSVDDIIDTNLVQGRNAPWDCSYECYKVRECNEFMLEKEEDKFLCYLLVEGVSFVDVDAGNMIQMLHANHYRNMKEDGKLSTWSEYGSCSTSCGRGIQKKTRTCIPPKDGGSPCQNDEPMEETKVCELAQCPAPVNGEWSKWEAFGSCSATCGVGKEERSRNCSAPVPAHGGAECVGLAKDERACNMQPCPVVPSGFTQQSDGAYYKLSDNKLSWTAAKQSCESLGATLAIDDTIMTHEALKTVMGEGDWVWLGATDELKEGEWRYMNGKKLSVDYWLAGQPNGGLQQNCMGMRGTPYGSNKWKWGDGLCTDSIRYVCQYRLTK